MIPEIQPQTMLVDETAAVPVMGEQGVQTWNMSLKDQLLSLDGRINRQRFWILGILAACSAFLCGFVAAFVGGFMEGLVYGDGDYPITFLYSITVFIVMIPVSYIIVAIDIKRLKDTNRGWEWGWISVIVVVCDAIWWAAPAASTTETIVDWASLILSIPLVIICGFFVGIKGSNQYGSDPLG